MSTLKISRTGGVLCLADNPPRVDFSLSQALKACGQFFGHVDTGRPRNNTNKLSNRFVSWLTTGRDETLRFREMAKKEIGIKGLVYLPFYDAENFRRKVYRKLYLPAPKPEVVSGITRAEKLGVLGLVALVGSCVTLSGNSSVSAEMPEVSYVQAVSTYTPAVTQKPDLPKNWLDGIPESNGFRKDALSGPLQYAKDSDYEFAATKERLLELVEEDTLVELEETKSLKFNKVSRPYVLPVVAEFVYRLADQYNYGQRCGPLWLNGAARDTIFQQSLGNGSAKSVHPTGMAVDFKSTGLTDSCRDWLEQTLLEIEAAKRIDFTKERSPAHYHISVATHEYEAWLERRRTVADSETDWLRKALFYEGGPNETVAGGREETVEGFRAIGWVIRNRARSKDYPNTIQGVVADGSAGKHDGGCQFSFMCDGKPEDRYELCRNESGKLTSYWRHKCDMRWEQVTMIAKAVMSETNDPTGGAVLYYATWMNPAPKWASSDMWNTRVIGSHKFGCGKKGRDACIATSGEKS